MFANIKVNLPKLDVTIPSNLGVNITGPSLGGNANVNIHGSGIASMGGGAGIHAHGPTIGGPPIGGGAGLHVHGPPMGGNIGLNVHGPEFTPGNINVNLKGPSIGPVVGGPTMGPPPMGPPPMGPPSIGPLPGPSMYAIPEFAHDHPLICLEHLQGICKLCKANIGGLAGYRCDGCDIILCFNCALRIFFGIKKVGAHQHPLTLTNREKGWKCDICNNHYNGGASFRCNLCDFDACDICYLGEGYPEGFIIPQVDIMLRPPDMRGPPLGPPGPTLGPPGPVPPQQFPPQPDLSFSSHSTTINMQPNLDEINSLRATIDSLQKQLAEKDLIIKNLETDKNAFFSKMTQYEGDLNRLRDDLTRCANEKDVIIRGKDEENKSLSIEITELNKKINFLESQLKMKETEIGSINGRAMEEKNQLHIQIDNLNVQLTEAQNQLKRFDQIMITIKNYEEFLNKLKIDITQFQQSSAAVTVQYTSVHG